MSGMRASRRRLGCSRSGPPLLRLGPPSITSTWRERRPRVCFSRSVPRSRGRERPSSSGTTKS
jgi:hypothetical protein